MLTSTVVVHFKEALRKVMPALKSSLSGLAYFYFDRNDDKRNHAVAMLRSFVRQLSTLNSSTRLPEQVVSAYEARSDVPGRYLEHQLTFDECKDLILQLFTLYNVVTLVIDGLDECSDSTRPKVISLLDSLIGRSEPRIKVFISTRPHTAGIKSGIASAYEVDITTSHNTADIKEFIQKRLQESTVWKREARIDKELEQQIVSALHKKSDGM